MGYRAFFSYARTDESFARKLHGKLDRYRTPRALLAANPDTPPHFTPSFATAPTFQAAAP